MPTLVEKTWFMREAGDVIRNHTWPTLRNQTDGGHSFNAVMIYLIFCPEPTLDVVKVLMTHDCGERGAGDLPAPAKWANPQLNVEYEICEDKVLSKWSPVSVELDKEGSIWVRMCDKFEFALFVLEELSFGNRYALSKWRAVVESLRQDVLDDVMPKELWPLWEAVRDREHRMIEDKEMV